MSKELEALENLYHNIGNSTENYLILETALKRLEELEIENSKQFKEKWVQDNLAMTFELNVAKKKLKALDIIKEKNIDVRYFIDDFVKQDYGWDLYDDYSEQYHYGKDDFSRYNGEYLTKEQFELLKEILV